MSARPTRRGARSLAARYDPITRADNYHLAAYSRVGGRNCPDIAAADRPINFVAIIRRKNENIEFALTLFCEKDIMSPTVETQRSWNSPAATGPDVAQSLDLYFPRVEDLLHRLAISQAV